MKIGVIFGGASRARESSFAAGRNIYESLNKALFTPVPVFLDSLGNFILLEWPYLYRSNIRAFYPPAEVIPDSEYGFPIYIESLGELSPAHQEEIVQRVGRPVQPHDFKNYFDFALLALPEPVGEEISLTEVLATSGVPYFGASAPAAVAVSPRFLELEILADLGFPVPPFRVISAAAWANKAERPALLAELQQALGLSLILKNTSALQVPPKYIAAEDNFEAFAAAVDRTFFSQTINKTDWQQLTPLDQLERITEINNLEKGIGLPVRTENNTIIHHPEQLLTVIQRLFTQPETQELTLYPEKAEQEIVVEQFIEGEAFSCTVLQNPDGTPVALHPVKLTTENFTSNNTEDLVPAGSKPTLLNLAPAEIQKIRHLCQQVYQAAGLPVFAQIQGVFSETGEIFLIRLSGCLSAEPFSWISGRATQVGLNPTQFLTYLIYTSLVKTGQSGPNAVESVRLLQELAAAKESAQAGRHQKIKVAVLLGDGSYADRFLKEGLYVYQQLAASGKYQPLPIFLIRSGEQPKLFILPLNMLSMGNSSEIKEALLRGAGSSSSQTSLKKIWEDAEALRTTFAGTILHEAQPVTFEQLRNLIDAVFISLPEGPGAPGALQAELEKHHLPYTGAAVSAWQIIADKNQTSHILRQHGLAFSENLLPETADQPLITVEGTILTRYLPDGRLGYDVFVATPEKEWFRPQQGPVLTGEDQLHRPDPVEEGTDLNKIIAEKLPADFIKVAQVLNIEGYADISGAVQLIENQELETHITAIDLSPALTASAGVFFQAAFSGYKPYDILDRLLQFGLERHKLQAK